MAWSYTYDTATPVGTDAPSVLDDRIREVKQGIQERINVDHYFPLTGTQVSDADAGEHRQIEFYGPLSSDPTAATNKAWLYTKDVSSVVELWWKDESGNEKQITTGGVLNLASAELLNTLANDTYFTAVDNAGTGTVDLIKANTSDVAVVPDGSELASSGAPTEDADIANKKYVDDQVAAAPSAHNFSPSSYTGVEFCNLPNGKLIRSGTISVSSLSGTHTFGASFPNGIVTVILTNGPGLTGEIRITAQATSGFDWYSSDPSGTLNWYAEGY